VNASAADFYFETAAATRSAHFYSDGKARTKISTHNGHIMFANSIRLALTKL
jgi:hypothetical protein